MSLEHEDLITSRIEQKDVRKLIENRFDGGSNVVYFEEAEGRHIIYISNFLELILGGHESVGEVLKDAFVNNSNKNKPELNFDKYYTFFGKYKVLQCEIDYPSPSLAILIYPSLEDTEAIFNRAIRRKIRKG